MSASISKSLRPIGVTFTRSLSQFPAILDRRCLVATFRTHERIRRLALDQVPKYVYRLVSDTLAIFIIFETERTIIRSPHQAQYRLVLALHANAFEGAYQWPKDVAWLQSFQLALRPRKLHRSPT